MHDRFLSSHFFAFWLILLSFFCEVHAKSSISPTHIRRGYSKTTVKVDRKKHDLQFYNYVTRPDIDAPRWDIKVYDKEALSPGYWFVAPYAMVDGHSNADAWVGPHIYDAKGELVWSGAPHFNNYQTFDFKVCSVNGEDMLTLIWPHGNVAAILDSSYETYKTIHIGKTRDKSLNMHDFQIVENGTRALFLKKELKRASKKISKEIGYNGNCNVKFIGFEEVNLATGKTLFTWTSEGRIGLDESAMTEAPVRMRCTGQSWDYL